MSAPVDVLAVIDHVSSVERDWGDTQLVQMLTEARAAVAELIAERDRLSRIACSHAAQILRMRDERDELMLAAENALGNLTTAGTPRPIKGKERAHAMLTAALARCKGGAA